MQNMASRPRSFHDDLTDQLGFFDCDPTVREACRVHHLQPRRQRLFEARACTRWSATSAAKATLEQAEEALAAGPEARPARRRRTRPARVPAPSADPGLAQPRHAASLICHHLDDLQHNRLPAIEKKTGISIETIKEAIEHLRRLNPSPGASFTPSGTPSMSFPT